MLNTLKFESDAVLGDEPTPKPPNVCEHLDLHVIVAHRSVLRLICDRAVGLTAGQHIVAVGRPNVLVFEHVVVFGHR